MQSINYNNNALNYFLLCQINEDTGTIRSIQRKTGVGQQATVTTPKLKDRNEDERAIIFKNEPELGKNLVQSLTAVLYDVYYSSVGPAVKHKCLCSMLKMLYHSPSDLLKDVLVKIPISSYIAGMLPSQDLRIVCSALQKADILMTKLSDTFHVYFRREGVMHKVKELADGVLAATPSSTPNKATSLEDNKQAIASSVVKKSNSSTETSKGFDDIACVAEGLDVTASHSTSR